MSILSSQNRRLCIGVFLLVTCFALPINTLANQIAFMVIDANSYLANLSVQKLKPENKNRVLLISAGELTENSQDIKNKLKQCPVIVVDVMGKELEEFLTNTIDTAGKTIYALRGSTDDERLKKQGFIFDEQISNYYQHISQDNIVNMLRLVVHRHFDKQQGYEKVEPVVQLGIYHPLAPAIFTTATEYLEYQQTLPSYDASKPHLALLFFSSFLTPGQKEPIDQLITRLEAEGFNLLPCFGRDLETIRNFLLDENHKSRVDLVLAYSLKFYSALSPELAKALKQLGVPIISAISLYKDSLKRWQQSPVGIANQEIAWSMAAPELSGLIEPTVLTAKEEIVDPESGKHYTISRLVYDNFDRLLPRLHRWIKLQQKANRDKKLAILYYNHNQGKQNIGASYLNVFGSIATILKRLHLEGYQVGTFKGIDEKTVKQLILSQGRNVGSWAPGELDKLVAQGDIVRLDIETYSEWFQELPEKFKENVMQQWGKPSANTIMIDGNAIVVPIVQSGNVVLMPEPARGWVDDPEKLYHDNALFPHHQYIAAYLWLKKSFRADAMIHLGTHATYEWTPGKQAGLSISCSPEVLVSDIPNLYPYIVDNVGEALQAKRRGRGVMISHLTPVLKQAGLYKEYSQMADLASDYERAVARGSSTATEKFVELEQLLTKTGVKKELKAYQYQHNSSVSHKHSDTHHHDSHHHSHPHHSHHEEPEPKQQLVHMLLHYLEEIKEQMIPFGMHSFGTSKKDDESAEMIQAIVSMNQEVTEKTIKKNLQNSPTLELDNLVAGLEGRYVEPGGGNDPLRNPEALPTGRNLYGLNPNKLPSKAAWKLGKKAAEEIIANHKKEHGTYPQKVAVVLWAVELLRNEGVNESTILYLMGIKPRWQTSGRVAGLSIIPRKELGRPRIDVMINSSGLYRDLFPEKLELIDEAVQLAIRQTDLDNLLAKNSRKLQATLIARGFDPEEAEELSRMRVFSEESGSYGNGVGELTSASSLWSQERDIVKVFQKRSSFAFGQKQWSKAVPEVFRANLARVDTVVHSSSSQIYGLLDNDDMYQYLGGLTMAVRQESGSNPKTYVTYQKTPGQVRLEDLGPALGREIRSRYLNPKWIEGMKKEDYAGARAMAHYIEYLWGWQVTTPEKVTGEQWQESYAVYVEDKYQLDLKKFFNQASPWAYQSLTARMLETARKGYWKADDKVQQRLAMEYAVNVVKKGVACCDHTCNNPMLNQMVISLLSLPGVVSPEIVEKFQLAIEKAAKKPLADQVRIRKKEVASLSTPTKEQTSTKPTEDKAMAQKTETTDEDNGEEVKGYIIEKLNSEDETTNLTSSGVEWLAGLVVLFFIALLAFGSRKKL